MRLFHFTSSVHGLAAIRTQTYKLSTFDNLNDPFELFAVDLSDSEVRGVFRDSKERMSAHLAMLCCSKSWSSTLLWSHYADRHRGMALELEVDDAMVRHVRYQEGRTPMTADMLSRAMTLLDPKSGLGSEALEVKAQDWRYEDEARIFYGVSNHKRSPEGLLFSRFDDRVALKGVILGPLCNVRLEDVERSLPIGTRLAVSKARIAFRSFRVVRDLSLDLTKIVREEP